MDAVLSTYLDTEFLNFVLDFLSLAVAGCALGFCCWGLGFLVQWFASLVKRYV